MQISNSMFHKMTVRSRLLAGFGLVIALLIAVAVLGLVNLRSLNNQVSVLANSRVPQVIAAGQWEAAVLRSARHMEAVFVLADPQEIKKELDTIGENRAQQTALYTQMRDMAAGAGQGRALLQDIDRARKAYAEAESEFVGQAQAGKMDEAKATLLVKVRPAQVAYIAGISKLGNYVVDDARGMAKESADAYRSSVAAFIAAALLCVAAASAVALLISGALRRQLGGEPAYATSVVRTVAGGDLAVDVQLAHDDRDSLLFAMREMIVNLRSMVAETARGAHAVADTSSQIAQGNLDLSQRTEEQASTLQDTASSMEELTSTVARNAQNAREASKLAAEASSTAQRGGEVVDEVVSTMDQILDASKKISDIISVIDGIAFQTNILALNAAVEAARAGEQGRGFAVVAAEVRNLAHRTTVAAKEIKGLIGDSTQKVQAGSDKVDAAGHTMVGVVLSVQKVSDLIAEIAAASQEQSSKINQVSGSVLQMDRVVQQNASLVEEAAAATESMKEQAGALLQMVSRFRVGGEGALSSSMTGDVHRYNAPLAVAGAAGASASGSSLPAPYLAAVMKGAKRLPTRPRA
ncbi:methyl-accepting chemotaxis protein [Ramlibacter sp.]|uniref:methyl-accepting chemotaxis protein n=1 Tax=Ramlibacter sp. TaxID=1917967 RepID=UPI0017C3C792|nr:methyl-accepting chemotaxis protein [Ramlibacter sp.]MBA2675180.1 MCP four helix bundle domain-containing protein [Ramlibacter sp.]